VLDILVGSGNIPLGEIMCPRKVTCFEDTDICWVELSSLLASSAPKYTGGYSLECISNVVICINKAGGPL